MEKEIKHVHVDDDIFIDGVAYTYDGEDDYLEEGALAQLLLDEVLCPISGEGNVIMLFVGCGDVFAWGCSDYEKVTLHELESLYRMHMADRGFGATKWVCLKRGRRPQWPLAKMMMEAGAWDDELEALPARKDWPKAEDQPRA